jgi:hypothetical protein
VIEEHTHTQRRRRVVGDTSCYYTGKTSRSCRSSLGRFRSRRRRSTESSWRRIWKTSRLYLSSLATSATGDFVIFHCPLSLSLFNEDETEISSVSIRGTRFSYTYYQTSADTSAPSCQLSRSSTTTKPSADFPIHASIEALDKAGMAAIATNPPTAAHTAFAGYLSRTKNTICGRHPIGVLLATLGNCQWGDKAELRWTRYERSSLVTSVADSSVSYASAFVRKV